MNVKDVAKHFAIWQEQKDILSWDSQTATFDPNIKNSEDERKAAISYAYDLDAYKEGSGVNINDVVMGFYGGLKWQKEQDEKNIGDRLWDAHLNGERETKEQMMKDAIEGWVARDECGDIAIFSDKPHRDLGLGMWTPARHAFLFPRKDEYPDVTWNSEPQKVKVIIIKE